MPYYGKGDYYKGDYYRGDFLGLGGLVKRVARGVAGAVGGFAAGGLTGAIAGGIGGLVGVGAHASLPQPRSALPMIAPPTFAPMNAGNFPAISNYPVSSSDASSSSEMIPAFARPPITKGYHLNKSTYETRGGGTSRWGKGLQLHEKGTTLVKNRRMNVGNARALKRSLRRAAGFARLARRVMSFTHPRAGRGHFKFKKRGKR